MCSWLERLQLSGLVWYEALAAYTLGSLLTTKVNSHKAEWLVGVCDRIVV